MTKLTIVYTDGFQEHYTIDEPARAVNTMTGLKRYKDVIEDDMLKLVIDGHQLVLIPIANIRKIISQGSGIDQLKLEEFPGFLRAKVTED